MKKVAGSLKLDLAQYREVMNFSQFASDLDPATQSLLNRGSRLTEMMKQKQYQPYSMAEEVVSIFAGVNGYLDEIDLDKVSVFEKALQEKVLKEHPQILESIINTNDLIDETRQELEKVVQSLAEEMGNTDK